jgi:Mg2+/Co2+ transporter CorB
MLDVSWLFEVLLVLFLILCAAFFSAAETSFTAVSKARIYHLLLEGNKRAKIVYNFREQREKLIGTILLGSNVVNVAATAVATGLAIRLFGQDGVIYVTVLLTILGLICGEILPKTFAFHQAERVALAIAPLLEIMVKIFFPITHAIEMVIQKILRIFNIKMESMESMISATDAIRGTIEMHHQEGEVVKQERDMLGSILDLNEVEIHSVMTHRKQLEMIDADLPVHEIIKRVINSSHSRLPFWSNNPDNITGVLHCKDMMRLLAATDDRKLTSEAVLALLSPPWFVPDTTTLNQQLLLFREKKRHFAIVVDEYGVCQGIVTLEDILEEIVGDIVDEHDTATSAGIRRISEDCYRVQGVVTIRDLNRFLDWDLPDENATTVAGLVLHEARAIPDVGAVFVFHGFRFTVEEKRANQLLRLQIQRISDDVVA